MLRPSTQPFVVFRCLLDGEMHFADDDADDEQVEFEEQHGVRNDGDARPVSANDEHDPADDEPYCADGHGLRC
jgi:hypothetical protein